MVELGGMGSGSACGFLRRRRPAFPVNIRDDRVMIGDLILEDSIIADHEDLGDKDPIDAFVRRSMCVVVGVERTIGVESQFLFEES